MTDVMTVGGYPHSPLPGPKHDFANAPVWRGEFPWEMDNWYIKRWPKSNPILEPPMYFPGAAWKGTSGMPQRIDPVVYA
jgi:hypothetical protein